jgi:predicted TIM-barrel fold metal-dependent hydrolase
MLTDLLEATTEDLIASGLETGRVRVAGWMREGLGDPGLVATARVERLVVDLRSRPTPGTGADGCVGPWLADVMEAARSVAVPVYVAVGCGAGVWAAEVVESGLGGVIAPVAEVQDWKSALRNAAYSA